MLGIFGEFGMADRDKSQDREKTVKTRNTSAQKNPVRLNDKDMERNSIRRAAASKAKNTIPMTAHVSESKV